MSEIIDELRQKLIHNSDEKTKISGERFFKEAVKLYGLRSADVVRISKFQFKALEDTNKSYVFSLCAELKAQAMERGVGHEV